MTASAAAPQLHHMTVVGGLLEEWAELSDEQWGLRVTELGKVVDHVGATWLTLRPFGPSPHSEAPVSAVPRTAVVGSCRVVADPEPDGRVRIVGAIEALRAAGASIDETSISARLNHPAQVDPDLVVVLGPPHLLPPSLVWELAYGELVFIEIPWMHLGGSHLEEAVACYARRHRRFGGVD